MKRLIFLDFLRGLMIFIMITYHALVYNIFFGINNALAIIPEWLMTFLLPILLLLTWAAMFALISGIVKGFHLYQQITADPDRFSYYIKMSYLRGIIIYLLHFIYLGLLGHFQRNLDGLEVRSLLIGSMEVGYWKMLDLEILFFTDALAMTSVSGMIVTFLIQILWKNKGIQKTKRNFVILYGVAFIWLIISPILHNLVDNFYYDWMINQKYIWIILSGPFIGPRHCLFPYLSFAILGAIIGISLSQKSTKSTIRWRTFGIGSLILLSAVIVIIIDGMPQLTTSILPFSMVLLNLGLMLIVIGLFIQIFEFKKRRNKEITKGQVKKGRFFRRFGLIALSMYIWESFISLLLVKLFRFIFDENLQSSAILVISYLIVNAILWWIISRLWEKIDFKYSFEWFTDWILKKVMNHQSNRLKISESLYNVEKIKIIK